MTQRKKMSRENRAKQFMPFSALKGYEEALRQQEKMAEERMEKERVEIYKKGRK